ncbi:MAG: preprotein translocase subunit SecD, partial [Armatimonadota bacterium]
MKHKQILAFVLLLIVGATYAVLTQKTKLGLDLAGGTRVVLQAETDKLPKGQGKWTAENLRPVIEIIRKRIDAQGVAEPVIQPKGNDQVVIELPDIKNKDAAIKQLQSTARLEFQWLRSVKDDRHPMAKYHMESSKDENGDDVYVFTDAQGNEIPEAKVLEESPLILTGNDLLPKSAGDKDPQNYQPEVRLQFTKDGRNKFEDLTRTHVGEHLA